MLAFLVLTCVSFSLFGFIIGIWAQNFDQLQLVPMLIVSPLVFLGGAFYSIASAAGLADDHAVQPGRLPDLRLPLVVLRHRRRGGRHLDRGDRRFTAICLAIVWWIFRTGYRLRTEPPHAGGLAKRAESVYRRATQSTGGARARGGDIPGVHRLGEALLPAAAKPERKIASHGSARIHLAPAAGSRRPLRPPDPPLEPAHGAVHLRRPQRHPHHRPDADRAAARPGAARRAADRGQGRAHPLRRHQAAGAEGGAPTRPSGRRSTT